MPKKRRSKFEKWFSENQPIFAELATAAKQIVEAALKEHRIPYLAVTARPKTLKSALSKVRTKGYRQPKKEMTI
jgi:tRNA G46 methylase TrmB